MTAQTQIKAVNKEHFHELRSQGIGASDVAPLLGLSKYKTPLELWMEKTGKKEPFAGNELTRAGTKLEKVVVEYFEEESGHRVIKKTADDYLVIHPDHDYIRCHPDREYYLKSGGRGVLECKTGYYKSVEKGSLPLDWYTQNQYQLGILGYDTGSIAWMTFSFGPAFDWEEFAFDPVLFDHILNEAGQFWINHVLKDIPPAAINSEDTLKMFPEHVTGKRLEASDELFTSYLQILQTKEQIKALEADLDQLTEPIKMAMGDAESVYYNGEAILTWKKSKDSVMVDSDALKTKYPEIFAECSKVRSGARRFLIK